MTFRSSSQAATCPSVYHTRWRLHTRGGVEDTRLEAKAKDTKKIRGQGQGQGQPFRGQTLSRPRTGMLEAKAKDQGHKAQVLSKKKKKRSFSKKKKKKKKKKSSQKFFKRSPLKDVFQKFFQAHHKILTFQKIVLSSSRGQANFRGLEASRPRTSSRTPPLLHTVPLIAERQAGKLWIPIFIVFGLTRPGIEPESTASVEDALSTRPLIGYSQKEPF